MRRHKPASFSLLSLNLFAAALASNLLTSCFWQDSETSRGVGMERSELAAAFTTYLGNNADREPLTLRTGKVLSSRNSPCNQLGLTLPEGDQLTGPHFITETMLREVAPGGKISFFWCDTVGKVPSVGHIYLDESLYQDGACGLKSALEEIRKLYKTEKPGIVQIEGVCHTLLKKFGPLSLILEIGGQELVHPELPGAEPFHVLYLKSIEIKRYQAKKVPKAPVKKTALPKPDTPKDQQPALSPKDKALAVYTKPSSRLSSLALLLGDTSKIDPQRAQCGTMLPSTFSVALQFNYFDSEIVKKSKSSGNADVKIELVNYIYAEREVLAGHRIGFKPKDFIGIKPLSFTTDQTGMLRIEALLDGVLVSKKDIVLQSVEVDLDKAHQILKQNQQAIEGELAPKPPFCTPALDARVAGVGQGMVGLPL